MVRGNRLNAKLNISQVRKDNKEQGIRAVTKAAESLAVRWTEPATPHWGSLGSREIKCSVVAFSPGTSCKLLFIPFFLTESGAEMFRQEIIYVSIFQRHFIVWKKKGRGKANIKTNLTWDEFFFEIKICVLLFISLLSFQLYYVV